MIHRIYCKVNSAEELESLKHNFMGVMWWSDGRCECSIVADVSEFVTEIFLDTDPTTEVKYPQLVCAEVQY